MIVVYIVFYSYSFRPVFVYLRDVRNRFFNIGLVSVRFLKKTRIRFGMSLVLYGSNNLVQFGYYSYLLLV